MQEEMNHNRKPYGKIWLSRLFVLAAVFALFSLCMHCYPSFSRQVQDFVRQTKDSRPIQAFSSLSASFDDGLSLQEAFSNSYQILTGEKN